MLRWSAYLPSITSGNTINYALIPSQTAPSFWFIWNALNKLSLSPLTHDFHKAAGTDSRWLCRLLSTLLVRQVTEQLPRKNDFAHCFLNTSLHLKIYERNTMLEKNSIQFLYSIYHILALCFTNHTNSLKTLRHKKQTVSFLICQSKNVWITLVGWKTTKKTEMYTV